MALPRISVEGGPKLRRTLTQAGVEMDDLKALNARLSRYFAFRAAAFAPKRSGRLAASGRGAKAKGKVSALFGRKSVPYAGPVHWGWPSRPNAGKGWRGGPIAENRFILRAADEVEPFILGQWEKGLQAILRDVKGA